MVIFITEPLMLVVYDGNVGSRGAYSDIMTRQKIEATTVSLPVESDINSLSVRAIYI